MTKSLGTPTYNFTAGIITTSCVVASQLFYLRFLSPQLKSPPKTGHKFVREGILVEIDDSDALKYEHKTSEEAEIRIALLGDSIIAGLGSTSHQESLGGQTAYAIMKLFKKPVRYWSFGKAGLTTEEIEKEMVPLLRETVQANKFDLIIISCGTNNIIRGHTTKTFRNEFNSLIDSIQSSKFARGTPIITLGLFDLSTIPLLPFPTNHLLDYRRRKIQKEIEYSLYQRSRKSIMAITKMPSIKRLSESSDNVLLEQIPLHLRENLNHKDFFAEDGFHPAKYGTILLGSQIAKIFLVVRHNREKSSKIRDLNDECADPVNPNIRT